MFYAGSPTFLRNTVLDASFLQLDVHLPKDLRHPQQSVRRSAVHSAQPSQRNEWWIRMSSSRKDICHSISKLKKCTCGRRQFRLFAWELSQQPFQTWTVNVASSPLQWSQIIVKSQNPLLLPVGKTLGDFSPVKVLNIRFRQRWVWTTSEHSLPSNVANLCIAVPISLRLGAVHLVCHAVLG